MAHLTHVTPRSRKEDVSRKWHLIDLNGKVLGREVTEIASLLIGKKKTDYEPHIDGGDYVVVINAKNVAVTGRKTEQKVYTRYSGYPGGLREATLKEVMQKDPRKVIFNAVSGMLPKNKLRAVRMTRLYVFTDNTHPYSDKF